MTIPLVERAEELKLEDLSQINLSQSQAYNASLFKEHLSSSFDYPRVLLSLKGGGKTVVARKALNSHIQENQESLPVMLVYKQNNRSEILDYNKLATPGQWGEKRLEILKKSSTKELMKRASAIVYDDAHYRFEAVADGREEPQRFLKELKEILEKAKKDTSTIILSENSLGVYSEQVNIEGLDDILAKCGQFSYEKWLNSNFEEKIEYQNSINYHACSEISPLKECEWSNAFYTYGIHVETPIDKILFRINPAPRAVVKFAKTFSPEREIDIEMFNEKTMEIKY